MTGVQTCALPILASDAASQTVTVGFDLPLALPASASSPSYGFAINGTGVGGTVVAVNNNKDAVGGNVTNLGDINGDGLDDLAIADPADKSVYVVYGRTGNAKLGEMVALGNGKFIVIEQGTGPDGKVFNHLMLVSVGNATDIEIGRAHV